MKSKCVRLLSVLVLLAMVVSLSVPALAVDQQSHSCGQECAMDVLTEHEEEHGAKGTCITHRWKSQSRLMRGYGTYINSDYCKTYWH